MAAQADNVTTKTIAIAFMLIVVTVLFCYYPTLNNGLLQWDDEGYILENPGIRSLNFETVRWAFTTFYVNYWAPLTWISLAIDYALWGTNPVGYHLTNNIIHALNSGLFFVLMYTLSRYYVTDIKEGYQKKPDSLMDKSVFYCSLFAALMYSLHPLRVQSVAWATERKDVLCAFFGILTLVCYVHHAIATVKNAPQARKTVLFPVSRYYALALLLFIFSLLSKSLLVVLPLAFLVIDWFPLRRHKVEAITVLILEKIPFIVLSGIAGLLTVRSQGGSVMSFAQTNFISRFFIACKSVMLYLWMSVWPFNISPFYVHPGKSFTSIGFDQIFPVVVCAIITGICLATIRKYPVVIMLWLCFLITLFPVLGLSQSGPEGMAARFTYVAGMAVAAIISLGFMTLLLKYGVSKRNLAIVLTVAVMLLSTYCFITQRDIADWKNDIALWNRVIELNPHGTGRAYYQRSYAYMIAGQFEKALNDIDEAYRIAASKNYNRMFDLDMQRARVLRQLGNYQEALASYSRAIDMDSSQDRYMYMIERGNLYMQMGKSDLANNDFKQAGMPVPGQAAQ